MTIKRSFAPTSYDLDQKASRPRPFDTLLTLLMQDVDMQIPSFHHTDNLSNYRIARDGNGDGRIQRHEIVDSASLGDQEIRNSDLKGLYLQRKGFFTAWKPSEGWHVASGVIEPVRVSDRVISIEPEKNLVTLERQTYFSEPSGHYMHL